MASWMRATCWSCWRPRVDDPSLGKYGKLRLLELPGAAVLEFAEDTAGDDHAVHLIGAVVDAGRAGVAVHALEGRIAGDAAGAVRLDRAVYYVVQHLRAEELDGGDLHPRLVTGVDLVGCVHGQQPARLDLGSRVCNPV